MSKDIDNIINNLSDKEREELVKALTSLKEDAQEDKDPEGEAYVDDKFIVQNRGHKSSRGKSQVKAGKNKWVDDGELRDVETPDFERTPRRRSSTSNVKVEGHVCGKTFKSDPRYLYGEYHRCNKCTGR